MNFRIIREKGTKTIVDRNGSVAKVIPYAKIIAHDSSFSREIEELAGQFGYNFKGLFDFLVTHIDYEPDPDNEQRIRTADRTLYERKANCLDFTVLLSAYLQYLGVPHYYKLVRFKRTGDFEHIYIVLENGLILDPVVRIYNHEANFKKGKTIKI